MKQIIKENNKPVFNIQYPNHLSNPVKNQVSDPVKNYLSKPMQNQPSNPVQNQLSDPVKYQPSVSMKIEPSNPEENQVSNPVQNYAIIVPCYNEEKRFPFQGFLSFAKKHPEVLLCFVNDGSTDKTLSVLRGLQTEHPENICVYSMNQNGGKSEAVRQGMLYMHRNFNAQLLGFLDADLATTPEEWLEMAKYKEQYPQFGAIVGSRIQRLGARINRNDNRSLLSSIIKQFIRILLKANFQDTQCGAKIFEHNLVPFLFNKPFHTPWLFDVEIFLRLQKKFGKTSLQNGVLEFPLMHWTEVGDSRLKLKHSIKIPMQLLHLYVQYHVVDKLKTKQGYSLFDTRNSTPAVRLILNKVASFF